MADRTDKRAPSPNFAFLATHDPLLVRYAALAERCVFDGAPVGANYRVRIGDRTFCGVRCAESWLARAGATPAAIRVTDCVTGRELDAHAAWYVRTLGGAWEDAPDSIRVFASEEAARRHAEAYAGELLRGAQTPFGGGK